jgi:hypothetical protein
MFSFIFCPDQPTRSVSPRLDILSKKDVQVPATQPADSFALIMAIEPTLLSDDVSFLLLLNSYDRKGILHVEARV